MLQRLYQVGIRLYSALLAVAALWVPKARLLVQGRKETWRQLQAFAGSGEGPVAWFHCASLGEFEQGRPVIEAFSAQYPQYRILLTFYSPSGYEPRKHYAQADCVCYLPADTFANAKRLVTLLPIGIAFFVKYEFWYAYLSVLASHRIPTISFSAIFREEQYFFKPYGTIGRRALRCFTHIFVQDQASAPLLGKLGLSAVSVAPDTRFDRVYAICQSPKRIPIAEQFAGEGNCLVVGSAWQADIEVIAPALAAPEFGGLRLIVAPHEIDEGTLVSITHLLHPVGPVQRFSHAMANGLDPASRILLIDNIGMLSSLYQYGKWAYIGGAFGKGLHNTLEAATFGLPLLFGPVYGKFQEAVGLVEAGAGFPVEDTASFAEAMLRLSQHYHEAGKMAGQASAGYVRANLGGTSAIMERTAQLLSERQSM